MRFKERRDMKLVRQLSMLTAYLLLAATTRLTAAQTQSGNPAPKQETVKVVKMPPPVWPSADVSSKHIEGKVTVRIVIDANGKVTDAEALSGPPELFPAAIAEAKLYQFERPASAPAVQTVEISYGYPKECPIIHADSADVMAGGLFRSNKGNVISAGDTFALPPYPEEERKAGIEGELRLVVSVNRKGKARRIDVAKSLSPELDRYAIQAVRKWKFKLVSNKGGGFPDTFQVPISFKGMCNPSF